MKKFIIAAAALAVAVIGFGGLNTSTTHADPAKIWVVNMNIVNSQTAAADCTAPGACDLALLADRQALAADFDKIAEESAGQVGEHLTAGAISTFAGQVVILVESDGSLTNVTLNGKGMTCAPLCDGVATVVPDATDHIALWSVTDGGSNSRGDTLAATAVQDSISLNSETITIVGQAHDISDPTVTKSTIQEAAASCETTDSISAPTRGGAIVTYTDIDGTDLVGYFTSWSSSDTTVMKVAAPTTPSWFDSAVKLTGAENVFCGEAPGTADLKAKNTVPNAISGVTGAVTRTTAITVTGVPASIALTASPATIACDGTATSTVTAKVTDSAGNNVVDNTNVNFSVVALGTANPINVKSKGGEASSTITPLSGATAGVTVIVTSGDAQASIRVDCSLPVPTVPAASPTPTGGTGTIVGPNTGTGGYLGQDGSAGFPMWTLVALVLGSLVLVGGGMVTRRAGK